MRGNNNTASEKWGVVRLNAYMVAPNLFSNKGNRWEKSAVNKDIPIKERKGMRNKNKDRSAARPNVFNPFEDKKPEKIKKATKANTVGDVSKKAA